MPKRDFNKFQKQIEDIELNNNLKDYHAFIFWFIETAFGLPETKILNSMCDGTRDKGIDAVIIDPIEMKVVIIQSKYERAGGQVQISENEIKLLATVRHFFDSRSALKAAIKKGNQVAKKLANEAFDAVRRKGYSKELIFISTHKKSPNIDDLISDTLGFDEHEFRVYDYERIMQLFYDKMRDFTPSLGTYNLPFTDADKAIIKTTGYKAWVITTSIEDVYHLVNKHEDNLFRKNVRNFLGRSRTNKKIMETLEKDPTNFWYYNNGVTILCDRANIVMEKGYIRLENPQIVNGCQTVKSIQKFEGDLRGELMIRVVESTNHDFVNFLTLYQNSSNPVRNRDLKSNDPIQIRLKHEFRRQGYYYEIKRGEEYDKMVMKYPALRNEFNGNVMNNEFVAKLLAILKIDPATALGRGSDKFFGDYYDTIFPSNLSTFNCLAPYYFYDIIRDTYKGKTKQYYLFDKDWVFKNRALFYILDFFYRALGKRGAWEKHFVLWYEASNYAEYQRFYKKIEKIINRYFKFVYNTWDQVEYYNSYLQNSQTMRKIQKKFGKEIDESNKQVKDIFNKFVGLSLRN